MTGASAAGLEEAAQAKQAVREHVWALLEREHVARFPRHQGANPQLAGAARAGRRVGVAELEPVDLVVCGSVAVNRQGARVGKGGGFSDLELALLVEAGLTGADTLVATTVHPLQVLDEALPETAHDFHLDLIVTDQEVIRCRRVRRPPGILWEHLAAAKIAAIPALAAQAPSRGGGDPERDVHAPRV